MRRAVWSQAELSRFAATARVENARSRVVKAALRWAKLQTSVARARDLALACARLAEAQATLDALDAREGQ